MDSGLWILEGPGREVGWILVSFEKSLESDYSREFLNVWEDLEKT